MAREEVADALARLAAPGAGLLQHGDGVGGFGIERQGLGEDVDGLVDVVVVAGDLDADARAAQQAAHRGGGG